MEFRPYVREAWVMPDKGRRKGLVDADSVRLFIDNGFGQRQFEMGLCRLFGINAWEPKGETKVIGLAATERMRELILPEQGYRFWIESENARDYGMGARCRWLVRIWLKDGTFINDLLVAEGHAIHQEY